MANDEFDWGNHEEIKTYDRRGFFRFGRYVCLLEAITNQEAKKGRNYAINLQVLSSTRTEANTSEIQPNPVGDLAVVLYQTSKLEDDTIKSNLKQLADNSGLVDARNISKSGKEYAELFNGKSPHKASGAIVIVEGYPYTKKGEKDPMCIAQFRKTDIRFIVNSLLRTGLSAKDVNELLEDAPNIGEFQPAVDYVDDPGPTVESVRLDPVGSSDDDEIPF